MGTSRGFSLRRTTGRLCTGGPSPGGKPSVATYFVNISRFLRLSLANPGREGTGDVLPALQLDGPQIISILRSRKKELRAGAPSLLNWGLL